MYAITIRDHIMIAHSLSHESFGPASEMHGATYIVDVTFSSPSLNDQQIVMDIAVAHQILKEVLKPLNYKNLDEYPPFKGALTTTEFLAKYIHERIREKCADLFNGNIKVTLGESHVAWASYED